MEKMQYARPQIREHYEYNSRYALTALIMGILLLVSFFFMLVLFDLTLLQKALVACTFIEVYGLFLIAVTRPYVVREINRFAVKTVEKPTIREVVVEKPVFRDVIVEKPVYRDVVRTVVAPTRARKLNIPKYAYVGSNETKRYHTKNCRLGKLIKKKFKINSNSKALFKKKKFKACKICILKKRKA